jgi:hypothetical protein
VRRLRVARAARVLAHKQLPGAAEEGAYAADDPVSSSGVSIRTFVLAKQVNCVPAEEVAYAADDPVVSVRRDRRQRLERSEAYITFLRNPVRMLCCASLVVETQEGLVYCKVVLRLQRQQT